MFPLVGIPATIQAGMAVYRKLFSRQSAFEHVSRYVSGLLLSSNKTLQGIHSQLVEPDGSNRIGRRAMHAGVFESPWHHEQLMVAHRSEVSTHYTSPARHVLILDWTHSHHDRGPEIFGVKRQYDYVNHRMSRYHTLLTAVVANGVRQDGLCVRVQPAKWQAEELRYLQMTRQETYDHLEQVMTRISELLAYDNNRRTYQTRTQILIEIINQIEAEGKFAHADYVFDGGVCARALTDVIEGHQKHWVSELSCNRKVLFDGQWQRIDEVAIGLKTISSQAFRHYQIHQRNGELKDIWAFSKVLRLKKIGRKRIVIVHEVADLSDKPRFLVTDALRWEVTRITTTWSYRWPCEIFHEFAKDLCGLESAQLRNEDAVQRHACLSCLAQSILQNAPVAGATSEKFNFANKTPSIGQKLYGLTRESLSQLLMLSQSLFAKGQSVEQVLEVMMPA